MEHRIFLTDLHEYNNGELIGDWVNIEEFDCQKHNFGEMGKPHSTSVNTAMLRQFTD